MRDFFKLRTIFDTSEFKDFHNKVKSMNVKVFPGVTLIKSVKFMDFLSNLPGVHIPEEVVKRVKSSTDPLKEGIEICAETIRELKTFADGVHIMAIGSEQLIPEILNKI